MRDLSRRFVLSLPFIGALLAKAGAARAQGAGSAAPDTDWTHYAANAKSTRYAPLDQINGSNFNDLEVAWRFKPDMLGPRPEYQYEATPLVIKGKLYTVAGSRRAVVCLDASNGEMIWMHSQNEGARGTNAPRQYSGHGVSYWTDGRGDERIIYVTPGYQMVALDAKTGMPIRSFGTDGMVDLKLNDDQNIDLVTGEVGLHSTPTVIKDTVVVGAAHLSGGAPRTVHNVKGYARGFDVRTGRRKWIFHTIPRKGEYGYDSWIIPGQAEATGNTGVWGQISADPDLGLVYLPVELPTGDYNGQYRAGNALFGESIVAVDVETGKRKWHYQTVHHGLWDMDIPCASILLDIPVNGKTVKAIAQPTKQCFLYVLNRETGEPIWPIPEVPVPAGNVPGEWYSPTQPVPSKPPAYDVQGVTIDDLIDYTPELRAAAVNLVKNFTIGPMFTPPTMAVAGGNRGTLHAPGSNGGTDWAGGCGDPETSIVYVFSQTAIATLGVIKNEDKDVSDFDYVQGQPGQHVRPTLPMGGARPTPGRPAARPNSASAAPVGLIPVANTTVAQAAPAPARPAAGGGDGEGGGPGVNVQGLPLLKPPYGRISALDLKTGTMAWQIAHGETPDNVKNHPALRNLKIPRTGRPGLVGPMVTKTLVICGEGGFVITPSGARGAMMRAYDKATGQEKGAVYTPAPSVGAPMTYMLNGEQYIVIGTGGGSTSEELIAFRLPRA
jgi:quinoprotein glucose dehydrogenase